MKKQSVFDAKSKDFTRFDQVQKQQAYYLAEQHGVEIFDETYQIKTCHMDQWFEGGTQGKKRFAKQLGHALEEIGFAILEGHRIPLAHYKQTGKLVEDFFESTSLEKRRAYRAQRQGSVNQGYFPRQETSKIHPDQVEGWVFCRRAFNWHDDPRFPLEDFWPRRDLEPHFRQHVMKHEDLILPIMQSLLSYLGCDPHQYDLRLTNTNIGLRFNYYPPVTDAMAATGAGRILGHEDVNMFTFLPAPEIEGLQVLNRKNSKWIKLAAPPGSIVLNTGDYMQRISNDRFPSTTHRVSVPQNPNIRKRVRISFPMAVYLWERENLEVLPELPNPRYEPIKAIAFHTRSTAKFYGEDYAIKEQG